MTPIAAHLPCAKCGSSDGASITEDAQGKQWQKCFVCGDNRPVEGQVEVPARGAPPLALKRPPGQVLAIPSRALDAKTAAFYGVETTADGYLFPYGPSAAKVRTEDKRFTWVGDAKESVPLFGMDRLTPGDKTTLTITEGEFDALAAYQMSGGRPVVSVRNGSAGAAKDLQAAYEWLSKWEGVVLAFDNDKPGKEAVEACAKVLGFKCKVLTAAAPHKDANDYLKAGQSAAWVKAWWGASEYRPDGVVNLADLWEEVESPYEPPVFTWPYEGLDVMTEGVRKGELVVLCAGTGIGKSTMLRELTDHIINTTEAKLGLVFLEESRRMTAKRQVGLRMNAQIWRRGAHVDPEKLRASFDAVAANRRVEVYSHHGVQDPDSVLGRLEYMVRVLGVAVVMLDHLSIMVSGLATDNERKAIDILMTKLRGFSEATGVPVCAVSHLTRPDGTPHEEGGRITLAHLRGSGSIAQLADMVIAGERNQQSDNPAEQDLTLWRVLKNRNIGEVGPACYTRFDRATGRVVYAGGYVRPLEEAL